MVGWEYFNIYHVFVNTPSIDVPHGNCSQYPRGVSAAKIALNMRLTGAGGTWCCLKSNSLFCAAVSVVKCGFMRLSTYSGLRKNMK